MQRLLQGDVGSGKTIVAALAALQAIESGKQVAFMAPTEILAEQHFRKLQRWLDGIGIEIAWLSGSLPAKQRRKAQEALASGERAVRGRHARAVPGGRCDAAARARDRRRAASLRRRAAARAARQGARATRIS